jgi:hypothetical protein
MNRGERGATQRKESRSDRFPSGLRFSRLPGGELGTCKISELRIKKAGQEPNHYCFAPCRYPGEFNSPGVRRKKRKSSSGRKFRLQSRTVA